MVEELDYIARFAMTKRFNIKPRTIFVEGNTDVDLFELAARMEKERSGNDLLGDLAIIAAGDGELGGASGVCRELVSFKNMAGGCLLSNGRPKYRFIGLFDNDRAGRQAILDVRKTDTSILEYKDVFRLHPVMPTPTNRDVNYLQKCFENENKRYNGLDWELEDLLSKSFLESFIYDHPDLTNRAKAISDKKHHDWSADGKAKLHRYIKMHALYADVLAVVEMLLALRHYLNLKLSVAS